MTFITLQFNVLKHCHQEQKRSFFWKRTKTRKPGCFVFFKNHFIVLCSKCLFKIYQDLIGISRIGFFMEVVLNLEMCCFPPFFETYCKKEIVLQFLISGFVPILSEVFEWLVLLINFSKKEPKPFHPFPWIWLALSLFLFCWC